jgi:formylmethanofuran dehydrogenase subunit B
MFSLQKHGKVSATLGEISSRSDLVVFWFCDPVTTHPRHLERYSRPAAGPARKIIVVDEAQTATAAVADQFIRLSKSNAAAMLMALRASMAGIVLNASQVEPTTGHAQERIDGLADQLKSARYGAFVYGHTTQDSAFDLASDQLAQLTRELNQHTRFVSLGLRSDANARSAENVIAWSSGYPFAVNYAQSIPRFNRLEHSAAVLLERGECDLIVAGPGIEKDVQSLSPKARKHFQATAKIMLTSAASEADAAIVLHVAAAGIDSEGDFCRQDDVALPLTKLVATERPSAVEAIEQILAHVRPRVLA